MTLLRALLGWLARRAVLFALIVAGLVAWAMLTPSWQDYGEMRARVTTLEAAAAALPDALARVTTDTDARLAAAQAQGRDELTARRDAAIADRAALAGRQRGIAVALAAGGPQGILDDRVDAARIALLDREIATLAQLVVTIDARRPGEPVGDAIRRQVRAMRAAQAENRAAVARVAAIDAGGVYARLRLRGERADAVRWSRDSAARFRAARDAASRLLAARRGIDAARADAAVAVAGVRREVQARLASDGAALGANGVERLRQWARQVDLAGKAWIALGILAAILITRPLIRVLFYFVLAPIAQRRPVIRLRPDDAPPMPAIPPVARSTVSVGIRLDAGEELLVRQGFLQTSFAGGEKRTRLLLDWRHPLTSLAAGLWFLTRLRGASGAVTTISATGDPFAEVAELVLPDGAAMVVQPRAVVAVVQPCDRPLRIISHWRLFSLHAWLTLQLRYLLFHGPARLVLSGGRGVRVEPAMRGRILGQDQLIGFGGDLAYTIARNETFLPYLAGREPLLRDRVADGGGVLVIEEAPRAARARGGVRGGLEGAFDAALKLFGV